MAVSMIAYDPNWQTEYLEMIMTPEAAVSEIHPGKRVFIGTGCAQPLQLVKALTARAKKLPDTEIVHLLTRGEAPYAEKGIAANFRINSFFIAENVRDIIQEGLGDYTPIFLSDIPRLFSSGQLPLDVALIQVTPPDERGDVQPRCVGRHRQERNGERRTGDRSGESPNAANDGRLERARSRH